MRTTGVFPTVSRMLAKRLMYAPTELGRTRILLSSRAGARDLVCAPRGWLRVTDTRSLADARDDNGLDYLDVRAADVDSRPAGRKQLTGERAGVRRGAVHLPNGKSRPPRTRRTPKAAKDCGSVSGAGTVSCQPERCLSSRASARDLLCVLRGQPRADANKIPR